MESGIAVNTPEELGKGQPGTERQWAIARLAELQKELLAAVRIFPKKQAELAELQQAIPQKQVEIAELQRTTQRIEGAIQVLEEFVSRYSL